MNIAYAEVPTEQGKTARDNRPVILLPPHQPRTKHRTHTRRKNNAEAVPGKHKYG
jgi:hypothetical protein